jgi:thiol-disulfide isomerase/thioredoxin
MREREQLSSKGILRLRSHRWKTEGMSLRIAGVVVSLAALVAPSAFGDERARPPPVNCPAARAAAPRFSLPRAHGGDEVSLAALLALKHPVIVDFWRYDCAPCLVELPQLQTLAAEWGKRASVVTVHVGDPEEKMLAAMEKVRVTLPTGFDAFKSVGERYCVY